jgi:ornithine carbamoyltransferase
VEKLGTFSGKVITYIGDGACNVPYSWLWAAAKLDFELRIAAPRQFQPDPAVVARACPGWKSGTGPTPGGGRLVITDDPHAAVAGADVLYTDVWVSMGKEDESEYRIAQLGAFQVDEALVALAKPGAPVMHCLPAYRGKEISAGVFEAHSETIFTQAENRLHAQKAILSLLARPSR